MRFTPKTEQELAQENLLPVGIYDFEIVGAEDGRSRAGNEQTVLKLKIFSPDGKIRYVTDYLLEEVHYKLYHAAHACGLLDKYKAGRIDAIDFMSCCGKLKLGIEKDKNGQYPDKNKVLDYIKKPLAQSTHDQQKQNGYQPDSGIVDDEVPF